MGLDDLLAHQRMTRPSLLEKQRRDLAGIIAFAADNTDYYRDRFAGLDLDGRLSEELPLLTKEDIAANLDTLLTRGARDRARIGHTGGSTGRPTPFWYDEAKHELMRAGMARSYMMSGWRLGQRIVNFWGAARDIGAGGVFDNTATERTLPAQQHDEATLAGWAETLRSYRPALLQGYASILAELARFVADTRQPMPDSLIGVYSTAETLDDRQRGLMERAFSCKVFNQYGSREIPNIACECRHGNMHVFTDMVWLESLNIDKGEEGDRLIVTSLTNRLMPMIRYDIGDSGRLKEGDCACGSPFPLMEMGLCRRNDLIRTTDGRRIHPSFFNRLLYGMTQIRQYQWIQSAPDRIVLNVVATPALSSEITDSLQESIRRDIDARMTLELNHIEEIARTISGKHRFVINRIA
ncbi:MAG: hypothetical protein OHM77_04395 [Candidatus Nitricoxidivorans perseverans]|uniref:Phenylacetate--CoA ligase family protein n=1 Tax=Candidatus Nitricoxidivorans perseverans TaxID=2975601 RepID=A0AA49FNE1_9PROT|nr:MAG: hypothetical protein OHM77_04395 [Candidatus Nitricoxidivorans perseverans]